MSIYPDSSLNTDNIRALIITHFPYFRIPIVHTIQCHNCHFIYTMIPIHSLSLFIYYLTVIRYLLPMACIMYHVCKHMHLAFVILTCFHSLFTHTYCFMQSRIFFVHTISTHNDQASCTISIRFTHKTQSPFFIHARSYHACCVQCNAPIPYLTHIKSYIHTPYIILLTMYSYTLYLLRRVHAIFNIHMLVSYSSHIFITYKRIHIPFHSYNSCIHVCCTSINPCSPYTHNASITQHVYVHSSSILIMLAIFPCK